jgi:hypothetical protein
MTNTRQMLVKLTISRQLSLVRRRWKAAPSTVILLRAAPVLAARFLLTRLAMNVYVMATTVSELLSGAAMDTPNPPCDFSAFVAQRRGLSGEQADQLIQSWLTHYCPRISPASDLGAESSDARDAARYDICA